ncbi:MAG: hypothetical protein ACYDA1_07620 [Vulcanimicrobiaceae bacterium]
MRKNQFTKAQVTAMYEGHGTGAALAELGEHRGFHPNTAALSKAKYAAFIMRN